MASSVPENIYYLHTPLFVLDVIRMFQDHPKYKNGLKLPNIVDIFKQEKFASGDLESQIELALKSLKLSGYVRCIDGGYTTLGPLAKLATAKNQRQWIATWNKIQKKF